MGKVGSTHEYRAEIHTECETPIVHEKRCIGPSNKSNPGSWIHWNETICMLSELSEPWFVSVMKWVHQEHSSKIVETPIQ